MFYCSRGYGAEHGLASAGAVQAMSKSWMQETAKREYTEEVKKSSPGGNRTRARNKGSSPSLMRIWPQPRYTVAPRPCHWYSLRHFVSQEDPRNEWVGSMLPHPAAPSVTLHIGLSLPQTPRGRQNNQPPPPPFVPTRSRNGG
jgi:hypothetical protein